MRTFLLALGFLAATLSAQAPNDPPTATGTNGAIQLFRAKLPGGTYEVALHSVVAVTSHEYLVDNVARVTEVNIDTTGSLLARFYFLEPVTPNTGGVGQAAIDRAQELLKQAAEKTGQDVWKKVVKNYPTTTHARTVEYRVADKADLHRIFQAAEEAFRTQRTKQIAIGDAP